MSSIMIQHHLQKCHSMNILSNMFQQSIGIISGKISEIIAGYKKMCRYAVYRSRRISRSLIDHSIGRHIRNSSPDNSASITRHNINIAYPQMFDYISCFYLQIGLAICSPSSDINHALYACTSKFSSWSWTYNRRHRANSNRYRCYSSYYIWTYLSSFSLQI